MSGGFAVGYQFERMYLMKISKMIAAFVILLASVSQVAVAQVSVNGADAIKIGTYVDAEVSAPGLMPPLTVKLTGGKLPYGLTISAEQKVSGVPVAVERTAAKLKVTDSAGKTAEGEVAFAVKDDKYRLLYRDLPVAKLGETTTVKIEEQGGTAPYGGCAVDRVRTFYDGGAAKFGAKAPMEDAAPSWFSVSADCTITAKPDREAIVMFIVSSKDASGTVARELYALRAAADPSKPGWLEEKAREYNKDYQERFSPNGITLERAPGGAYTAYGDTAIWTGTYLAGAAYYYVLTGEDYAKANLEKALSATTLLREITGVPGLIARSYENEEWVGKVAGPHLAGNESEHRYEVKDGPHKGWRYLTTASRDQYTGVYWGNATVFDIVNDPGYRKRASENIVSMSAHIWDHKMKIVDPDGIMTRHGLMSGYGISDSDGYKHIDPYNGPIKMANGMNAVMLLNWFDLAATVAPDEATRKLWRDRYLALVSKKANPEPGREFEKDYLSILKKLYIYGEEYITYYETSWFNLNLLFNNYYDLIRFEKNDTLRDRYKAVLKWVWDDKKQMADGCEDPQRRRTGREKNPHFTWQYLASEGDRDPDKIFDALTFLIIFPHGPKSPYDIIDPVDFKTVPGHDRMACEAVPPQYRNVEDFYWQREPYTIYRKPSDGERGRELPGVDVITPYWMGRWYGFVPSNI